MILKIKNIEKRISNIIVGAYNDEQKHHSIINISVVTKQNKKNMNRANRVYAIEIPHITHKYTGKVYVKGHVVEHECVVNVDSMEPKSVKKDMKWFIYEAKDKLMSVITKKSLIPVNYKDHMPIESLCAKVSEGKLVKLFYSKNYFSCAIGCSNNTTEQILENAMHIVSFIANQGFVVSKIICNKTMCKSHKLKITK